PGIEVDEQLRRGAAGVLQQQHGGETMKGSLLLGIARVAPQKIIDGAADGGAGENARPGALGAGEVFLDGLGDGGLIGGGGDRIFGQLLVAGARGRGDDGGQAQHDADSKGTSEFAGEYHVGILRRDGNGEEYSEAAPRQPCTDGQRQPGGGTSATACRNVNAFRSQNGQRFFEAVAPGVTSWHSEPRCRDRSGIS